MLLLFKLQQYINDMNYDAFYIPNCSLRKYIIISPALAIIFIY